MNRPAIAHRRLIDHQPPHAHSARELVSVLVALVCVVALVLTTSESARFLG